LTSRDKDSKIIEFLSTLKLEGLENDLEEVMFRLHPQIKEVKSLVRKTDPLLTLVSGTGSVVFGIFKEKKKATAALESIKKVYPAVLAETLTREEYWSRLMHGV
jgi:4-diphosphocytidyl-2-C-methyl-D-erythritol kinase